jgi:hypothetical protein
MCCLTLLGKTAMLARLRNYFREQKQRCRAVNRKMNATSALDDQTQLDKFLNR